MSKPRRTPSTSHRERIANAKFGKPFTVEHCAALSQASQGRPKSEAFKEALSVGWKRRWAQTKRLGESWYRGGDRQVSDATRAKMSASHSQKTLSPEHRQRIAESVRAFHSQRRATATA